MNAAQDAMIEAYRKWGNIEKPRGFVRKVAARCAGDELDGEGARSTREAKFAFRSPLPTLPDPLALAELADEQQEVLKRIRVLSPTQQKVLALLFDGHDRHEIAKDLGVEDATVRSHVRNIRRLLDDQWSQSGGDA